MWCFHANILASHGQVRQGERGYNAATFASIHVEIIAMDHQESSLKPPNPSFDPGQISRPDRTLLKYYLLISLFSGPAFPITALVLFFKFETLRYEFREDGVSMSWGILFRREVHLTYRRIQDIHLTRNLIQRWMGLATVSIQTASGSSMPEMSLEGILQAEELRDFLYAKMRGGLGAEPIVADAAAGTHHEQTAGTSLSSGDESLQLLREIRDLARQLATQRRSLE